LLKGMILKKIRAAFAIMSVILVVSGCSKASASPAEASSREVPLVTFIELGSVNCIPCKAMQPVMEEVRQKYGSQVSVLFYDVWTKAGEPYGRSYGIRVIPTQVFLDKGGKEYFRHEGFFAAEELYKVLEKGGVKL
jgi:thioredoxin 1